MARIRFLGFKSGVARKSKVGFMRSLASSLTLPQRNLGVQWSFRSLFSFGLHEAFRSQLKAGVHAGIGSQVHLGFQDVPGFPRKTASRYSYGP